MTSPYIPDICLFLGVNLVIWVISVFSYLILCQTFDDDITKRQTKKSKPSFNKSKTSKDNKRATSKQYYLFSAYSKKMLTDNRLSIGLMLLFSILANYTLFNMYDYYIKLGLALIFCNLLLIVAFVDYKTGYLPDIITKPLIILGLIQGYHNIFTDFGDAILGASIGYGLLWLVNAIFRHLRGIDGMGYGDFKLLAAILSFCGIKMLPLVLLVAAISGILLALIEKIIKNKSVTELKLETSIAFGPSLVLAGLLAFIWGAGIIDWYLGLYSS